MPETDEIEQMLTEWAYVSYPRDAVKIFRALLRRVQELEKELKDIPATEGETK